MRVRAASGSLQQSDGYLHFIQRVKVVLPSVSSPRLLLIVVSSDPAEKRNKLASPGTRCKCHDGVRNMRAISAAVPIDGNICRQGFVEMNIIGLRRSMERDGRSPTFPAENTDLGAGVPDNGGAHRSRPFA